MALTPHAQPPLGQVPERVRPARSPISVADLARRAQQARHLSPAKTSAGPDAHPEDTMATQMRNGLWLEDGCLCAGTGCGGHLVLNMAGWSPIGWQGPAQHTFTTACPGHHGPGPCPPSQWPAWVKFGS